MLLTHYAQTIFTLNEKQTQPLTMELVIKLQKHKLHFVMVVWDFMYD